MRNVKKESYGVSVQVKGSADMYDGTVGFTSADIASLINHCRHPELIVGNLSSPIKKLFEKELKEMRN